jgi:hypothetical protein
MDTMNDAKNEPQQPATIPTTIDTTSITNEQLPPHAKPEIARRLIELVCIV